MNVEATQNMGVYNKLTKKSLRVCYCYSNTTMQVYKAWIKRY